MPDEQVSQAMVMKHWRQDWQYRPESRFDYQGSNRWRKTSLAKARVKGHWLQAVYQVDDSPRYQSLGRWHHQPQFSSWQSTIFNRPLPRREYSIRDDYHFCKANIKSRLRPLAGFISKIIRNFKAQDLSLLKK